MKEESSGYTKRQIDLIKRKVEPADQKEWRYLQDHGTDVLPVEKNIHSAQRLSNGKRLPDLPISDEKGDYTDI